MDSKPFWQSKTFWGVAATIFLQVLALFKVDLPIAPEALTDTLYNLASAVTALWTLYGHAVSEKKMSLT